MAERTNVTVLRIGPVKLRRVGMALAILMVAMTGAITTQPTGAGAADQDFSYPGWGNPGWPQRCNTNVALLIDRSASVGRTRFGGSEENVRLMKAAATEFLAALRDNSAGNGAFRPGIYVNTFATHVKPVYAPGGYQNGWWVYDHAINAVNGIQFWTGDTAPADYGPYGKLDPPRGLTNWHGAFAAIPPGANLVVLLTDGDPTWRTGATYSSAGNNDWTQFEDAQWAVDLTNGYKKDGTRIVAVHVGTKGLYWERRLQEISGPVGGSDYYSTSFSGGAQVMRSIADRLCYPRISANLSVSPSTATAGQTVTYRYTATNTGTVGFSDVVIDTDLFGRLSCPALGPGATCTIERTSTVPADATFSTRTHTAKAWGFYVNRWVSADAAATLRVRPPVVPT